MPREAFTKRLTDLLGQFETPTVEALRAGVDALAKEQAKGVAGHLHNAYVTALGTGATAPTRNLDEQMDRIETYVRAIAYTTEVLAIVEADLRTRREVTGEFTPVAAEG
jgi:hypothetical protein